MRTRARWMVYSTAEEGVLAAWRTLDPRDWWKLVREMDVQRSGDGGWAEVRDEKGRVVMVLVRVSGVAKVGEAA